MLHFKRRGNDFALWLEDTNGKEIDRVEGNTGVADGDLHRALDRLGVPAAKKLQLLNSGSIDSKLTAIPRLVDLLK